MSFEGIVEAILKEAQERGEFDNLPGKGKRSNLIQQKSALQITPILLYFQTLKLTFSAPFGWAVCLEQSHAARWIPREQVSEGLFYYDLNRHWRINILFKLVRINILV